ncbi:MAG: protein-glutamate O-methyltransferase CheR [Pseudomonadota bacterium]
MIISPSPLSDHEFRKFAQLIFKLAGINMNQSKKALVEGRLRKRLVALELNNYNSYYQLINTGNNPREQQQFIDLLTTNETWFFREEKHFDFVAKVIEKSNPQQPISFWSSACSSGQEPYSIAMLLAEVRTLSRPWDILATDISTDILKKAKQGVYLKDRVKGLTIQRQKKYMLKGVRSQENYIAIVPELKEKIEFKAFNLMHSSLPTKKFDFIFCRNVLIYFDTEHKLKVVKRLASCLKTDGYLFTGHSESLHGLCDNLKVIQPSVYQQI